MKADEDGPVEITHKSDFDSCMKQMAIIASIYKGQWVYTTVDNIVLMYEATMTKQLYALEKIVPEEIKVPCEPIVLT